MERNFKTDDYYYDITRKNIKKLRKKKGLTQQRLADLTELSRDYICDIESMKKHKYFTIATLGRISDALNTPIDQFFRDDEVKENTKEKEYEPSQ